MRKPRKPSKASVKRAADRAEGKELPELKILPADISEFEKIDRDEIRIGRPTSFKPEFVEKARTLCQAGLTDLELADFFGVSAATITNWKHQDSAFLGTLKNAKDISDERVERSLYHRAVGYSFDAEEIFQYQGEIVRAKVRKHMPPDTTAMIFWLKNRRKDTWRDVQRHEFGRAGEFDKLSDAELVTELAKTAQLLLTDQSDTEE